MSWSSMLEDIDERKNDDNYRLFHDSSQPSNSVRRTRLSGKDRLADSLRQLRASPKAKAAFETLAEDQAEVVGSLTSKLAKRISQLEEQNAEIQLECKSLRLACKRLRQRCLETDRQFRIDMAANREERHLPEIAVGATRKKMVSVGRVVTKYSTCPLCHQRNIKTTRLPGHTQNRCPKRLSAPSGRSEEVTA